MSFFTVLRADDKLPGHWVLRSEVVEAESPAEALEQVVGARDAGEGEYMVVDVKALIRVKAETKFSMEPMDPPEAGS